MLGEASGANNDISGCMNALVMFLFILPEQWVDFTQYCFCYQDRGKYYKYFKKSLVLFLNVLDQIGIYDVVVTERSTHRGKHFAFFACKYCDYSNYYYFFNYVGIMD